MTSKSLPLLVVVAVVGLVGLLASVSPVAAQELGRSFSQNQVSPGGELTVTISNLGLGSGTPGSVKETIPEGFTYVAGDTVVTGGIGFDPEISGRLHTFTLLGGETLNYKLTVDSNATAGPKHFSGTLTAFGGLPQDIAGESEVTVSSGTTTPDPDPSPVNGGNGGPTTPSTDVMRTLPGDSVEPGDEIDVTISNIGLGSGGLGSIEETLPAGFSYVAGSASVDSGGNGAQVSGDADGQTVTFTLLAVDSFTYSVSVGSGVGDGQHDFSGVFKDSPSSAGTAIGGDQSVTVQAPAPMPISRSFSADGVDAGTEVDVTISNIGLGSGGLGSIEETLPAGFSYVAGSASVDSGGNGAQVSGDADGQTVTFTLLAVDSFTYSVSVGSDVEDGQHDFSGVFKDSPSSAGTAIGGDTSVRVGEEPTMPDPSPSPVTTPDPTDTPEPTDTPGPTRTPRPTRVPAAPATPVAIEVVADVTAAEGATVVQPDDSATVSSDDGMATVMLPNTSRARTYQVMVSSDAAGCSGGDLAGAMQACATISTYDAEGNMESGVMLIRRATVVLTLDSSAVDELGGLPTVFQANALGAFSVYQRDDASDSWGMRRSSMGLTEDGGIAVTVTGLRSLGSLTLAVDEEILEQAFNQVHGITPTAVPTVAPTAVPTVAPTAVPTAVPTPEPTPVPPVKPPVGDTTLPVGLLVVLALTGALMVYTGSRVMRTRRSATRS